MSTTLTPYLSFAGNTREAFAFYEQALGARIEAMMRFADMPPPPAGASAGASAGDGVGGGAGQGPGQGCAPPSGDAIMHASLRLPGGARLFAGDVPPGMPFDGMKGVMLALELDTTIQAQAVFHALAVGGQVTMPMAPSFWAKAFGMVTDRFGVSWAINGEPIPMA